MRAAGLPASGHSDLHIEVVGPQKRSQLDPGLAVLRTACQGASRGLAGRERPSETVTRDGAEAEAAAGGRLGSGTRPASERDKP